MIPKKIHYCWLSGESLPRLAEKCLESWHAFLPDYEIVCWDGYRFDVDSVPYVRQACEARKWAFAADYIRAYALYNEGGIYLDSDVQLLSPLDNFLADDFFSSIEHHPSQLLASGTKEAIDADGVRSPSCQYIQGLQLQAAVMGATVGHPFLRDVMTFYDNFDFRKADGNLQTDILAPYIYSRIAENYGFRYLDTEQHLSDGMHIYPSSRFAGNKHEKSPDSVAVHLCMHSWHPSLIEKLRLWFEFN